MDDFAKDIDTTSSALMLAAQRVMARYPDATAPALGPISFTLGDAEWHLLTGANGSGKSTLLLALSGALTHHLGGTLDGKVIANGHRLRDTAWADWIRHVALLPQEHRYQLSGARLTVEEEIAFPLENLGVARPDMRRRVRALMEQLAIAPLARRVPTTLSGGEQQRVALAATLALQPRHLLLDDPCAPLDPQGTAVVIALLHDLSAAGVGGLVASAHTSPLVPLASHTLWLHEGAPFCHGPTRTILSTSADAPPGPILPAYTQLARLAGLPPPWPLTLDEAERTFSGARSLATVPAQAPSLTLPPTLASPAPIPVSLENVDFAYPGGVPVLRGVSARLDPGQIVALVGPNGAGKSTLARTLNGLLRPQRGTITLGPHAVASLPTHRLARHVGYLFQEPLDQLFNPTVRAEVAFAPRQLGFTERELVQRTAEALALAGLVPVAEYHPYDLSPIDQRWVALASVLAQGASVLVLDEPARGMDQPNRERLIALLRALRHAGYTLLVISHDMTLVAELADRVLHLVGGELRADAPPSDFFAARPELRPPVSQLAARLGYGAHIVRGRDFLWMVKAS